MLEACAKSSRVKRVVITSSMAAITDEPDDKHVLSEGDWNEKSSLVRNPYYYSKVRAERAAWDFRETQSVSWDLIVINPFVVIGPSMVKSINESNKILTDLINGEFPAIMGLTWSFVDVRDVAQAHTRALTADGTQGRYICAGATRSMREVVGLLKENGFADAKLPRMELDSAFGNKLAYLPSFSRPKGVGSYSADPSGAGAAV